MKQICLASVAMLALLGAGCSRHNDTATKGETVGTAGRAEKVSSGDRDFVQDVVKANMAEVDLSQLALQHASSADVKTFAQTVVNDHTAAGEQLKGVAVQNAIDAPTTMDESHQRLHDNLAGKQGADFDKDYVSAMIDDHQKLVDKLESRIDRDTLSKYKASDEQKATDKKPQVEVKAQTVLPEKSDDPVTQRINAWAADTYPAAYAHLQAAKSLRDTLKH
jgi:putative membrane protein